MTLRLDWCTHEAAAYACKHWHYSKTMPVSKSVFLGVWEHGRYIGAIVFGHGANNRIAAPFGLTQYEVCELIRVALTRHRAPVTRIVSIGLLLLAKKNPALRLVVSYADPSEDHVGGIYQAGNWTYLGQTNGSFEYRLGSRRLHKRAYTGACFGGKVKQLPSNAIRVATQGKHKYVYALDKAWRGKLAAIAKPYPKRVGSADSGTGGVQSSRGGASPTSTLHGSNNEEAT